MKRKIRAFLAVLAAAGLISCGASADVWKGSVAVSETGEITAPADGLLLSLDLEAGQKIRAGSEVGKVRSEKTFSPLEGTVAAIHAEEGGSVSGTVLEIAPLSRYNVSCTGENYAMKTPETMMIHYGETVYMRCSTDQSHRAVGFVKNVNGFEYEVEVTGGELYIGETVNIFRDPDFTQASIVGRGTVLAQEVQTVSGEGILQELRVAEGDRIERGQWLFSTSTSGKNDIVSEASGIVLEISGTVGKTVKEGDALATVALSEALEITVSEEDAGRFREGDTWYYLRGDDAHEVCRTCTVEKILLNTEDGSATVRLAPEEEGLPIGLSVTVTDETPEI